MTRRRDLSSEEEQLWRWAVRQTRPLPRTGSDGSVAPHNKTRPVVARRDGLKPSAALSPVKPPPPRMAAPLRAPSTHAARPADKLDPGLVRRLARGRRPIEAVLDLHGARQEEAFARLGRFITDAARRGHRSVLVITGKGTRARGGPERTPGVLRRMVPLWLRQSPLSHVVSGFEPAHRRHGGAGAFYVVLRRRK